MRELNVHLLRPGQRFVWFDMAGRIVRRLSVLDDHRVLAEPETLENIRVNPIRCFELIARVRRSLTGPDKQARGLLLLFNT